MRDKLTDIFNCWSVGQVPNMRKVDLMAFFSKNAPTIQGVILLSGFSTTCAYYSREHTVQGGILFKEIRYLFTDKGNIDNEIEFILPYTRNT